MSTYSARGAVQDRTITSTMEEYMRALPPGTGVTKKMLVMHGVPERVCSTYMHFFVKWGAAKRIPNSDPPAIVYTPHSDTRGSKVEWRTPEEDNKRPNARKKPPEESMPYITANGNELKVVELPAPPPEPESVKLDDLTLHEVREGFKLLLQEFGLSMYRTGDKFSLRGE